MNFELDGYSWFDRVNVLLIELKKMEDALKQLQYKYDKLESKYYMLKVKTQRVDCGGA